MQGIFETNLKNYLLHFLTLSLLKKIILDILSSVIYFAIQLVHIALHAAPVQKICSKYKF